VRRSGPGDVGRLLDGEALEREEDAEMALGVSEVGDRRADLAEEQQAGLRRILCLLHAAR
jgi:hypothetical protein